MEDNKILNALSYFSVIFAPFLVPLIVWIVGKDENVKHHAKRALFSHIIPVILIFIFFILALAGAFTGALNSNAGGLFIIIGFVVLALLYVIIFIWNIVQGIKVIAK